jgi:GT2 family glycosyltransferase
VDSTVTRRQGRVGHLVTGQRLRVVYIAGAGRSGSTLVERTLGAIPGWVNIGEMIELIRKPSVAEELAGCGQPFRTCEFWSEVGRVAFGSWSSEMLHHIGRLQQTVSRQRYVPRLYLTGSRSSERSSQFASALREYGDFYRALYDAVGAVSGAEVIVDASKGPGQALALQRIGTAVSLLHLVRDPRGVAYSWSKTQVSRPHGGRGAVMGVHSVRHSASIWAAFQAELTMIRPAFEHSARMRYEDFVADPRGQVTSTLRQLHLDAYLCGLDHVQRDCVVLSQSHGIAGNPSRFQHGTVRLSLDEEWQSRLTGADLRVVTAITTPWLLRYGYPLRIGHRRTPAKAAEPPEVIDWPAVSVVLPTRGRPELLREAVVSVVDQDYPGSIELIVVHDQEEPLTELKELATPTRSVALVENTRAAGLAGARNTGLEHTTSQFVASCDDDDFWDLDKLRLQMTRMLAEPDLVVLGAGIRLLMDADRVVEWPGDAPVVTRADLLARRRKELHSSTLLMRRSIFDQIGGYDEALPSSYAEDYEFLLRAVDVGRIGVVNTPLASIRKYNASWFRERAEVVAEALDYVLRTHPQIAQSRRGHARVLGQIAFARSLMGQRQQAFRLAARAFCRWPLAPHAALAMVHAVTGVDPRLLLASARKAGRGIT